MEATKWIKIDNDNILWARFVKKGTLSVCWISKYDDNEWTWATIGNNYIARSEKNLELAMFMSDVALLDAGYKIDCPLMFNVNSN